MSPREKSPRQHNSTLPARRSQMQRGGPIKAAPDGKPIDRRRKPRTRSEFARIYGSKKRVAWVKSLPCAVRDSSPISALVCDDRIQNHHITTGGMGRKANADQIIPLCAFHHMILHDMGATEFAARYRVDLKAVAARTEAAWQRHQSAPEHIGSIVPRALAEWEEEA
jgi:hypothetical protein